MIEMKEELLAEIAEIDRKLGRLESWNSFALSNFDLPRRVGRPSGLFGAERGELKAAIIKLVKQAGESGITVTELAASLKMKAINLYVWFNTTGRRVKEITKIGQAKYAWMG